MSPVVLRGGDGDALPEDQHYILLAHPEKTRIMPGADGPWPHVYGYATRLTAAAKLYRERGGKVELVLRPLDLEGPDHPWPWIDHEYPVGGES